MNEKRTGQRTIALGTPPSVLAFANIGGKFEAQGPLSGYFDELSQDSFFGEKTWEKAESAMQKKVVQRALNQARLKPKDIQYILAGDLLNQCIGSSFGLRELGIPFYGLYRFYKSYQACSSGEGMPYDREQDFQYYSLVPGRWYGRAAVSVALAALISLVSTWCCYQALLPPNRGDITKAELAENINALAKRLDYALWVDEDGYELAQQTMSWREGDGPWVEQVYGEPISDEPVYTVETDENGYVTAVVRTEEGGFNGEERSLAWLNTRKTELAAMAFTGTSGSGWQLARSPLLRELARYDVWDGAAVNAGGFALTAALEQEGYDAGAGVLVSREGAESGWYRFTVRLERTA